VAFASERYASRRDLYVFLGCLMLSVLARLAPDAWHEEASRRLRETLLRPALTLQAWAEASRTTRQRFAKMVAERDSASVQAALVEPLREENAQLRAILGLSRRLPVRHVPASVLHQAAVTDGYTLLLSAGSRQGVRPLAPVIAPAGLVGVVRSVGPTTSVAVGWAHPDFRASAMTEGGAVFGIVAPRGAEGPNTMLLELRGVPYRQALAPGTRVFTSGLASGEGGVFPRGILIGTVLQVAEEEVGWARSYLVLPAVHPASISQVIVLLETGSDLSAALAAPPEP
jgi:rod shape-determining protein MreC